MNKYKKIATAVVSTVMAGTMVFGLAGCNPIVDEEFTTTKQEKLEVAAKDADISNVTLNLDIGDKKARSVSFTVGSLISGSVVLPDGKSYTSSSLKPAWEAFQALVGCKFNDAFSVESSKIKEAAGKTSTGDTLADRDIITDSVDSFTTYSSDMLDLSNYLDEMPNYKAFLEANPIVRLSLTTNVNTGAMYYAPYFDGNNDIEYYELFKTNWVKALLDNTTGGDTVTTFTSSVSTKSGIEGGVVSNAASITSYMGTEGSWTTTVLDKNGDLLPAGIKIDYDAAKSAAQTDGTELNTALTAVGVNVSALTSGNIVDLQNAAINANSGAVTGAKLLKILQEYIKVAYYVGGTTTPFYTQTDYKLSDVFCGYSAAWDVDLYAALGRCLITNPALIYSGSQGSTIGGTGATALADLYLLSARKTNTMQRIIGEESLVGQLYGVRGLESRNSFSYIDSKGALQDARADEASYDAMEAFNGFWKEGLVTTGPSTEGSQSYYTTSGNIEAMSTYDYVNTQTPTGFQLQNDIADKYALEADYYYTPIINPVSKWDEDDSGAIETDEYFRFTESWRSVKTTGFGVPLAAVQNDPAKLRAVLTFIDTMFSDTGMITLTYGPKADDSTGTNGFWYNPEATTDQIAAGTYFEYNGKKYYSAVNYGGTYVPTFTTNMLNAYVGRTVNGFTFDGKQEATNKFAIDATLSYTNFARYVIGSALAIGNKLQSFEFQLTSDMGRFGALIVDKAVNAGVVKHTTNDIDSNSYWYTNVPATLPYSDSNKTSLKNDYTDLYLNGEGNLFSNNSADTTNLYYQIIKFGYDTANITKGFESLYGALGLQSGKTSAANIIECLRTKNGLTNYVAIKQKAWRNDVTYYNKIK